MSLIGVCAAILTVIAIVLMRHDGYEDGFIGRVALSGIIIAGIVVVLAEVIEGQQYVASIELDIMVVSVTLFMLRHVYRFLKFARTGKHAWKPGNDG